MPRQSKRYRHRRRIVMSVTVVLITTPFISQAASQSWTTRFWCNLRSLWNPNACTTPLVITETPPPPTPPPTYNPNDYFEYMYGSQESAAPPDLPVTNPAPEPSQELTPSPRSTTDASVLTRLEARLTALETSFRNQTPVPPLVIRETGTSPDTRPEWYHELRDLITRNNDNTRTASATSNRTLTTSLRQSVTTDSLSVDNHATVGGNLTVAGTITGAISGSFAPSGDVDMAGFRVFNIGSGGSGFAADGTLNLNRTQPTAGGALNITNLIHDPEIYLLGREDGSPQGSAIYFGSSTNPFQARVYNQLHTGSFRIDSSNEVRIRTAGAERVWINNVGNMGLGVTSPVDRLDIDTTARIRGSLIFPSGGTSIIAAGNIIAGNQTATLTGGNDFLIRSRFDNLVLQGGENESNRRRISIRSGDDPLRGLFVDTSGDVGIGITGPFVGRLQIHQSGLEHTSGFAITRTGSDRANFWHDSSNNFHITRGAANPTGVTISANGNFGIGTPTPATKLHTAGSGTVIARVQSNDAINAAIDLIRGSGTGFNSYRMGTLSGNFSISRSTDGFATTAATPFVINPSDRVGLGVVDPLDRLDVAGNIRLTSLSPLIRTTADTLLLMADMNAVNPARITIGNQIILSGTGAGSSVVLDAPGNSNEIQLLFRGAGTERWRLRTTSHAVDETSPQLQFRNAADTVVMRLLQNGVLGLNTINPSYRLHVSVNDAGSVAGFTNTSGTCTIDPTTTSLVCSSDGTLKTDITSLSVNPSTTPTLDTLRLLNPVTYRWHTDTPDSPLRYGLIAQELQAHYPELVSTTADGTLAVSYGSMTPLLIQAIKELDLKVDTILGTTNPDLNPQSLFGQLVGWLSDQTLTVFGLKTGRVEADQVASSTLCLDDICVTRDQLKSLLDNAALSSVSSPAPQPPTQDSDDVEIVISDDTEPEIEEESESELDE